MKKLILYGVRQWEMRRNIEYFMDDGYEIIGYSDTYYTSDIVDGKHFIPPEQLPNTEFDYIILLSVQENTLADMRSSLLDRGIPSEKITRPTMFFPQRVEKGRVDLIGDIEARYQGEEGLIFGLSYSFRGIFEKKLCPAFYDCSWHGLDLYYNYRIFQYMRRRGLLSGVKTALLVFPYNYFNYDMSQSLYQYRSGQIFALRGLDDWHNYRQVPEAFDYVTNYRIFGRKMSEFYLMPKDFSKYIYQNHIYQTHTIYQGKDGEGNIGGPWNRDYPETAAENTALFADFCRELAEMEITPVMVIAPWYTKGLSQTALRYAGKRKQEFYQVMDAVSPEMKVFDFFDVFADRREFFMDLVHLNSNGAGAFTELINQTVLRELREQNV